MEPGRTRDVEPPIESIDLGGGLTLPYVEQGEATGVPVILLHGVTDSWRSFEPVLPHLPRSLRAFALTQRGHGDAARPPTGYRTRDFAADVAGFMDAVGVERAVIVGHSMGSANAARFVLDYPERTVGLVLAGAFASFRNNPGVVDFWQTAVCTLRDPIDPGFVREFQESTLAKPVAGAFLDMVVGESLKVPARVWQAAFAGFMEDDFAHELERIAVPTLVIWGDRDTFCPRGDQDALLAKIARSRLEVYEGAGHALHWEEPERFAADVATFVRSTV